MTISYEVITVHGGVFQCSINTSRFVGIPDGKDLMSISVHAGTASDKNVVINGKYVVAIRVHDMRK